MNKANTKSFCFSFGVVVVLTFICYIWRFLSLFLSFTLACTPSPPLSLSFSLRVFFIRKGSFSIFARNLFLWFGLFTSYKYVYLISRQRKWAHLIGRSRWTDSNGTYGKIDWNETRLVVRCFRCFCLVRSTRVHSEMFCYCFVCASACAKRIFTGKQIMTTIISPQMYPVSTAHAYTRKKTRLEKHTHITSDIQTHNRWHCRHSVWCDLRVLPTGLAHNFVNNPNNNNNDNNKTIFFI